MEIINSKLIGTGACIPDFVLTNAMLEKMVDTNDEWIVQRTGVRERRIAKNTHTWELALGAAQDALADAGITAEELDLILVSTCSPDTNTPNTASILQDKLGARQVGAFDINNACTGFVSATDIADSYIKSGKAKTALVVSAETLSRIVDYTDLHSVRRRCRCGRLSGDRGRNSRHSVHLHRGRRLGCRVPAHGSPAGRGSAFR